MQFEMRNIMEEKGKKVIGEWRLQFWSDKEGIIIKG